MLLAIDVGNTNTKFAIWDGQTWRAQWRASTDTTRTADEYAPWLNQIMSLNNLSFKPKTILLMSSPTIMPL